MTKFGRKFYQLIMLKEIYSKYNIVASENGDMEREFWQLVHGLKWQTAA